MTDRGLWLDDAVARADRSGPGIDAALDIAVLIGRELPAPGSGRTASRWSVLTALARANVTVARVVEAHTDVLAILAEAGLAAGARRRWGVFAAEAPGARLTASPVGDRPNGNVLLTGSKPRCSLGHVLDAALVRAWSGDDRQLFEVDLRQPEVSAQPATGWVSRGLPTVTSVGLDFDRVPARPVGGPGWYLRRPGFAWGGMGVAACWLGAALGVAAAMTRGRQDEIGALHAGRVDLALHAARCVLAAAAAAIDAGRADGADGALLALRVRAMIARSAEEVLDEVAHHSGRQHHAEGDLADLGRLVRADAIWPAS